MSKPNGVDVVDDGVDVQGGEWEEDEDEPHLAYPGPHARGQVTVDEVMTKQGDCSSRKPPKQSLTYADHFYNVDLKS